MMKTTKMLPLVAIVSGILVGCGESSSSNGGGSSTPTPTPQTNYTFTFLKAQDVEAASVGSCTAYTRFDDSGTEKIKTYQSIGTNLDGGDANYRLVAFYSNADGTRSGDLISPTNGVISFTYESIPDNGFVTFEERNGTTLQVTSFSKSFLARDTSLRSAKFGVHSSGVGSTCVTGNNYSTTGLTALSYSSSKAGGDGSYTFLSQLESETGTNAILAANAGSLSLEAYTAEQTMIKEMAGNEVHQYAFANWASSAGFIPMVYASATDSITKSSNISFTNIDVNLLYGGFAYDLVEYAAATTTYNHPGSTNGETWAFFVSGNTPTTGWKAEYFCQVDTSWSFNINDSGLYSLTSLVDDKPGFSTSGGVATLDLSSGGMSFSSESGIQRISYKNSITESSQPYVVNHNVYSELDASVVIPAIEFFGFSSTVQAGLLPSASATFEQYFLIEKDSSSTIEGADFMNLFSHGNGIALDKEVNGIVRNEIEANESSVRLQSNEHIRLYRSN